MVLQKEERWRQPYRTGQKSLTRKEFEKLMSKVGVLEDEVLLLLAVSTGMRRRDITFLDIKNIDLRNRSITHYEHKKRRFRTIFVSSELTVSDAMDPGLSNWLQMVSPLPVFLLLASEKSIWLR
jgi:integrase